MDLIVAEKPSVAKSFAAAVGARWSESDQAFQSTKYRIVALRGHVLALKGLRDTRPEFQSRWDHAVLPALPFYPDLTAKAMYNPLDRKIVSTLKKHFHDPAITRIINAADAGREGELLFWEAYHYLDAKKPVMRFWETQALSKDVIVRGLENLKDARFYEPRKRSAFARQQADWLVGMNLTIGYTAAAGTLYTVGPVQTPVLAMIVRRDKLIEVATKIPYDEIKAFFNGFTASFKPDEPCFKERPYSLMTDVSLELLERVLTTDFGTVQEFDIKTEKNLPPKLYSLTTLQREASRRFDFAPDSTLRICQKLYEEYECLSYPRTDAEVVGLDMIPLISDLGNRLSAHYKIPFTEAVFSRRNMNNNELTDHHALIPLKPLPEEASESERKIYELVLYRFFQAFGPDGLDKKAAVSIRIASAPFEAKGTVVAEPGWRIVQNPKLQATISAAEEDEQTPSLFSVKKGQVLRFVKPPEIVHKSIDPPKHYTVDTLLAAMANVAEQIEDPELRAAMKAVDGRLSTPATQAELIKMLLNRGYIEKKKKHLISTPVGRALIQTVSPDLANPEQRAKMEQLLNDFNDSEAPTRYLADIRLLIDSNIEYCRDLVKNGGSAAAFVKLGVSCPSCGGDLGHAAQSYKCVQCDFKMPKSFHGHTLTEKDVKDLVTTGKTGIITFTSTQKNKKYPAMIVLKGTGLELSFPTPEDTRIANCPICHTGFMYEKTPDLCACTNCSYTFWRTIAKVKLTKAQLRKLFQEGKVPTVKGFKKAQGDTFAAGLILDKQGKVQFTKAT